MKLSQLEREEYVYSKVRQNEKFFDQASLDHSEDYIDYLRNKLK